MQDLFVDRLSNLAVHQGTARLDFARLQSVDPEKKEAVFAPSSRLVMPIDAFMQMADQIARVREAIIQQAKAQSETRPGA